MSTYRGEVKRLERAWVVFVHRAIIRPLHIQQVVEWLVRRLDT